MINMLRALMEEIDNMQEQMGSVSREIEILRKNIKKKMLEIIKPCHRSRECFLWAY